MAVKMTLALGRVSDGAVVRRISLGKKWGVQAMRPEGRLVLLR